VARSFWTYSNAEVSAAEAARCRSSYSKPAMSTPYDETDKGEKEFEHVRDLNSLEFGSSLCQLSRIIEQTVEGLLALIG